MACGDGPIQIRPGVDHGLGEVGVLGQEAVAGVHGVGAGLRGDVQHLVERQVALAGRVAAERERLVGEPDERRVPVGVGVDGDARQTGVTAGADDPDGDLTAVGDEYLVQRPASYLLLDRPFTARLVPQSTETPGELREGETAHFTTIVGPSVTICDVGGARSVQVIAAVWCRHGHRGAWCSPICRPEPHDSGIRHATAECAAARPSAMSIVRQVGRQYQDRTALRHRRRADQADGAAGPSLRDDITARRRRDRRQVAALHGRRRSAWPGPRASSTARSSARCWSAGRNVVATRAAYMASGGYLSLHDVNELGARRRAPAAASTASAGHVRAGVLRLDRNIGCTATAPSGSSCPAGPHRCRRCRSSARARDVQASFSQAPAPSRQQRRGLGETSSSSRFSLRATSTGTVI